MKTRRNKRTFRPIRRLAFLFLVTIIILALKDPDGFRNKVRRFNKRLLNPVILRFAGHRHGYYAVIKHVGRRSGRVYETPVVAEPIPGGFAIPLPYGINVDWYQNILVAGRCTLMLDDKEYTVVEPELVDAATVLPLLPSPLRSVFSIVGTKQFLTMKQEATLPEAASVGI